MFDCMSCFADGLLHVLPTNEIYQNHQPWIEFLISGRHVFGEGFVSFTRGVGDCFVTSDCPYNISTISSETIKKRIPAIDATSNFMLHSAINFLMLHGASKFTGHVVIEVSLSNNVVLIPAILSTDETLLKIACSFDEQTNMLYGFQNPEPVSILETDMGTIFETRQPAVAIREFLLYSLDGQALLPVACFLPSREKSLTILKA